MTRAIATAMALALLASCSSTRGAAARMLPADRDAEVLYVALGDSTVEGIGASRPEWNYVSRIHEHLRGVYRHARVENLGVAGATSRDVLERQLDRAGALKPDLVTLSVGPNDVTGGVPVADYERNVNGILGRLAAETQAVIVVSLLPDLAATPRFRGHTAQTRVGQAAVAFNAALSRAAERHGAYAVDLYRPSRDELPTHPELVSDDGYHPSDLGYERWAELMWQAVQSRIRV